MTKWNTFSHLPQKPNSFSLSAHKKSVLKLLLGASCLAFLLGYQPNLGQFPPIQKSIVKAVEPEQAPAIQAKAAAVVFQLPHPGYISTFYSSYHPGVDIAMGLGTPIRPIEDGTVTSAGYNFWGLGLVVEIDHVDGYHSLYAHLGKTYVTKGQKVTKGDYIGEIGLTGHTTGPHTHLEISKNGGTINPLAVLPPIGEMPKAEFLTPTKTYIAAKSVAPTPVVETPQKVTPKPPIQQLEQTSLSAVDLVGHAISTPKPEIKGLIKL